jgi:hypothetical protein
MRIALSFAIGGVACATLLVSACTSSTTTTPVAPDASDAAREASSEGGADAAPDTGDDEDKLTCQGLYACAAECQDEACVEDCEGQATSDAVTKFRAVIACLQENECQDQACAMEKCGPEGEACQ